MEWGEGREGVGRRQGREHRNSEITAGVGFRVQGLGLHACHAVDARVYSDKTLSLACAPCASSDCSLALQERRERERRERDEKKKGEGEKRLNTAPPVSVSNGLFPFK